MEWYSYVVAVILLISSVFSPWLVNRENNKHQLKLKKLDLYEASKRQALADFIDSAEDYLLNIHIVEQNIKYYASLNKLFIYFSNINAKMFVDFEKYAKLNKFTEATISLTSIVQVLSKEIAKE